MKSDEEGIGRRWKGNRVRKRRKTSKKNKGVKEK
jgi:hypothetical protein